MPGELFRSVAARPRSTGRRLGAVPLSVAVHAVVLVAVVTIPLIATTVELPAPRIPLEILVPTAVVVVPAAPPPTRPPRPALVSAIPGPPVVAPSGIRETLGIERMAIDVEPLTPGTVLPDIGVGEALKIGEVEAPPPLPATRRAGPVRVGEVAMPRKIHHVAPLYPAMAIAARVQGTVVIEAVIATTGAVQDARVVRSVALLDAAALDAVRQWMFTPTRLNGEPVPVILTVNVEFKLQ